ncbi:MAG TPA: flagellin lysine-N-methylase [Acidobacteriaceae bacterium]|nr:flagellin lysine-N-methylase [Acidobacteriaceae bacterium]
MSQAAPILPAYSEKFHCIGPDCEDSCCIGWGVPIDQATYEKYQTLPAGPLRTAIDLNILPATPDAAGSDPARFAMVQVPASHECPFLTEERLCRIQAEQGEAFLSSTCATYPRVVHWIDSHKDMTLSLSCPEAARLILLTEDLLPPDLLPPVSPAADYRSEDELKVESSSLTAYFWPIRAFVLDLIRNRAYPLAQRLFLLGVLSRRLDSIASGELQRDVPSLLRDLAVIIQSGSLNAAMEALPGDWTRQLDMVLRMAGLCRERSYVSPRFIECVQAFTQGIGNGPGATMERLVAHYAAAHEQYYAPFFSRHPHILENYLINTIFRKLFPFGHDKGKIPATPKMAEEFALLVAQFALIKGLLIGVAGFHKESFSVDHVIHTVQSASRHFEHHLDFLTQVNALLIEARMNDAGGLSILAGYESSKSASAGIAG